MRKPQDHRKVEDPQEVGGFYRSGRPSLYQALSTMVLTLYHYPDTVIEKTQIIHGEDGNEISLYISHPQGAKKTSLLYFIYTGWNGTLTAADPNYIHWRQTLAAKGLVVIGVGDLETLVDYKEIILSPLVLTTVIQP